MIRKFLQCAVLGAAAACARFASAQSITYSPATPAAGESVQATLTMPFDCTMPPPRLAASSQQSFTFQSIRPSGIVQCFQIPVPPTTTSTFGVSLGALPAGTYSLTWNIYQGEPTGAPVLLASVSASVAVAPAAVAAVISPGFTGNWYDPDNSGHGFSLEVLAGNVLLAEWFVFAPDGGQAWIVASGPIAGDSAVLQGYFPAGAGGRFPPDFNAAQLQNTFWGTLRFTFADCSSGRVSWQPAIAGYTSGAASIKRLTQPAGLSCP